MNWKKAISFGILIWLIMFALVSATLTWYYGYQWFRIVVAVVAGIISWILVKNAKPGSMGKALGYSIIFVIIGVILDALISRKFNANIFTSKSLWLGYALILLAPLLAVKKKAMNNNTPPPAV